jgi:hypothetical protein
MQQGVRRSYRLLFWSAIIVGSNLIFSCQNEDCVSTFNNHLLVGFFDLDTLENGSIEQTPLDTVFYEIVALGNDSIFYNPDTVMSTLTLPVDPSGDMAAFELYMIESISYDTLSVDPLSVTKVYYKNPNPHRISVSYRRVTRVISEDCGVEIQYVNLKVDEITFSNALLVEDKLSRFNEANIEVYF